MALYDLLQEAAFEPDDIACMTKAYEAALVLLRLQLGKNPVNEAIARKIIEVFRSGKRDPAHICARAIQELGIPLPE
jgi:hypothetical protein